ncbi:type II toxin-antitoxin system RelE/ParE family toxin [Glycocaulis profundi]|nr:type II toxin-antitoxin system RelE/ParE family toxin [Glycocaulis profundi]
MTDLRFTPAAIADLDGIWDYTARTWSPDQADEYVDQIHGACVGLASGDRVSQTSDIRQGYRKARVSAHMIWFREREGVIEIVRILHARMDVDRHL